MITEATAEVCTPGMGSRLEADLAMVWAAGIKAPDFAMKEIAGSRPTASSSWWSTRPCRPGQASSSSATAPPARSRMAEVRAARAQSAHQMATQAFETSCGKMNGGEMKPYRYHDHGSLVSFEPSLHRKAA